jgi:hypothetical protein
VRHRGVAPKHYAPVLHRDTMLRRNTAATQRPPRHRLATRCCGMPHSSWYRSLSSPSIAHTFARPDTSKCDGLIQNQGSQSSISHCVSTITAGVSGPNPWESDHSKNVCRKSSPLFRGDAPAIVPGRQSGNWRHPLHLQCPRPQSAYTRLQRHGITTTKSCVLSSNCNCVLESLLCACTPLAHTCFFRNHDGKLTEKGGVLFEGSLTMLATFDSDFTSTGTT